MAYGPDSVVGQTAYDNAIFPDDSGQNPRGIVGSSLTPHVTATLDAQSLQSTSTPNYFSPPPPPPYWPRSPLIPTPGGHLSLLTCPLALALHHRLLLYPALLCPGAHTSGLCMGCYLYLEGSSLPPPFPIAHSLTSFGCHSYATNKSFCELYGKLTPT